jgi:long-subunit acyl-CoA synthetase (AMP-forming)
MKKSFCEQLIEANETHAARTAMRIVGVEAEVYTYEQMLKQIRAIAYRLEKEGIAAGERVVLIGENHPCWAIAYLGNYCSS